MAGYVWLYDTILPFIYTYALTCLPEEGSTQTETCRREYNIKNIMCKHEVYLVGF
jgi:hypothetical protein